MQRRREIAAAPKRTAAQAWQTIRTLVADTLDRSSSIARADVDAALEPLAQVARMLISGGHFEKSPLVLVAGGMWLEIATVSGDTALTLEENVNPVPGAASARDWTLHLPQVEPAAKLVRTAVKGRAHLSTEKPVALKETEDTGRRQGSPLDLEALKRWAKED